MLSTVNQITETHHFFGKQSKYAYSEAIQKAVNQINRFLENDRFYSGEKPEMLKSKQDLLQVDREYPLTIDDALEQVKMLYLDHAISFHHPDYVAHLNCPVTIAALVGDLIASAVNTAVETWDQSTSATLIEQEVIRWICHEMKLGEQADGVFTSGGTQSNFMAQLMARDHYAFEHFSLNIKENGWSDVVNKFRIFCSEKAHFSIKKNAALLGMGYHSVVPVKVDERMKLKPEALARSIKEEKEAGNIPIAVVATMGTTDYGSFDPLADISPIAQQYDMWLHVDGAYGGCYVLTDTHKHLLNTAHQADSITIDFHKTLFQPVSSSAFLLKDQKHFRYVSHYADYLNPLDSKNADQPNLLEKSIQTTRRFDALKLWFTLKVTGRKALAASLEKVHLLALEVYETLKADPHFEVAHKPELSTMVFRFKSPVVAHEKIHNAINKYIKNTLFNSGQTAIASTKLNGSIFLKFTFLNPATTIKDVMNILKMINETGLEYKAINRY